MEREIKFRAWHKQEKIMATVGDLNHTGKVHVSYQKGEQKPGYFFGGNWVGSDWEKDEHVLMQYTGLKLNGKEVYEGDILGGYPHGTIFVEWDNEFGCFMACYFEDVEDEQTGEFTKTKVGHLLANEIEDCKDAWNIIGNIHENPELLNLQ